MDEQASRSLARYQRLRRFVIACVVAAVGVALLFVHSVDYGWRHEFVEAVGIGAIGFAILGRMWCSMYIGGRKASEIVTVGPYSISRNPLYVFSAIAAAGTGAQTGSISVALIFAVATVAAFHLVIRREEAYLGAHFAAAYDDYRSRVPRFWPRFGLYRDSRTLTVFPARIYRTLGDGLIFFVTVPLLETVEWMQESGALPVVLHLP